MPGGRSSRRSLRWPWRCSLMPVCPFRAAALPCCVAAPLHKKATSFGQCCDPQPGPHLACRHALGQRVHVVAVGGANEVVLAQARLDHAWGKAGDTEQAGGWVGAKE